MAFEIFKRKRYMKFVDEGDSLGLSGFSIVHSQAFSITHKSKDSELITRYDIDDAIKIRDYLIGLNL